MTHTTVYSILSTEAVDMNSYYEQLYKNLCKNVKDLKSTITKRDNEIAQLKDTIKKLKETYEKEQLIEVKNKSRWQLLENN
jgi:prefoldin subunit 5